MKNLVLLFLTVGSLTLTGCLHIIEEVTMNNNGSGSYKMTLDMSEVKGMMEMLKNMGEDSTAVSDDASAEQDNSMAQMGDEMSKVAGSLKGIPGLRNIQEINDTSTFMFGYSFEFNGVEALNKALKVINKEKYDSNTGEVFKMKGKTFERLDASDLGKEIQKALSENSGDEGDESMDMVKMFFADMSYQQVYNFPERTIKKSSNGLSELSNNNHTVTINIKPFDEEQQKQKVSVGTVVKLK
ncbi:MAG: hypothetical protein IPL65_03925 [Lewinellaceae bacterium]|nr:hypothetical protein [Lewinellaceae bacterium]